MIIQCPACATRYVVPDSAIGVEGRTVRCAKCRHSWYQDGPELALAGQQQPAVGAEPAAPEPAAAESIAAESTSAESVAAEQAPPPPPPPPPPPVAAEPEAPPPVAEPLPEREEIETPFTRVEEQVPPPPPVQPAREPDPGFSPFDAEPPFRPRRNWLKIWTWAASIFAVFAAVIIFAVSYWGLPDWVPVTRPDFAAGEPDLQLDFPIDQQEKREMPNGQEYFAVNGTITNIGSVARNVPPILVVLRDARERNVFELVIVPEQSSLAPGESLDVTRAVLDVPRSARIVEIGWKAQ